MIGGDVSGAVNGDDDDNRNNVHNSEEVMRGHATLGMISEHYCRAEVDATTRDGMGFISIMIQQTL